MRLPTTTANQKLREDSRQFCELVYQAFLDDHKVILKVSEETTALDLQQKISWTLHKFWRARGFSIHTHQGEDKTFIRVWLSQSPARRRAA